MKNRTLSSVCLIPAAMSIIKKRKYTSARSDHDQCLLTANALIFFPVQ